MLILQRMVGQASSEERKQEVLFMREKLLQLIPEFNEVRDHVLSGAVIKTWETALNESGMTPEDLVDMPFTLLINPCPVNFIQHTRAVTRLALAAADIYEQIHDIKLKRDLLAAGALLHDVGKIVEYRRDGNTFVKSDTGRFLRHPFTGVSLALKCGIPPEAAHMIAAHSREGDIGQRTPESWIIHYADFSNFEPLCAMK